MSKKASKKDNKEIEDVFEEEGDPIFNSETQKIEHQVIIPKIEDDNGDLAQIRDEGDWLSDEFSGQLSVDVYQTDKEIVIKSTIAGVRSDDLDIQVTNDMVTIKGIRRMEEDVSDEDYFYRECYWGRFSRSIILPVDVRNDQVAATVKNGVLTIRLPKTEPTKVSVVKVKE
ncbi:MAG: Hsp20/alpha crystallin family protein [bacterium]